MTTILIAYAAIVTIVAIAYALAYARVKADFIEYRTSVAFLAKETQDAIKEIKEKHAPKEDE